ncbi:hypothetical protein GQ55_1G378600 [Panicum hallii var. hallii]|uniref:Uncharacterized protein n=1 Tax=Panicum hallii var. hallii TaxID=1504633 RepID=A0A2T7FBQ9_9POAL|nr:hypothetical protein GQ55_1G378600 [Panicum hallii var. hallii]
MAMARKSFVLPLLMAVLILLVVSGAARRLDDGDRWAAGEAASGVGGHPIIQFLKRLYLQQLSSGLCRHDVTSDPNSPPACPPPP